MSSIDISSACRYLRIVKLLHFLVILYAISAVPVLFVIDFWISEANSWLVGTFEPLNSIALAVGVLAMVWSWRTVGGLSSLTLRRSFCMLLVPVLVVGYAAFLSTRISTMEDKPFVQRMTELISEGSWISSRSLELLAVLLPALVLIGLLQLAVSTMHPGELNHRIEEIVKPVGFYHFGPNRIRRISTPWGLFYATIGCLLLALTTYGDLQNEMRGGHVNSGFPFLLGLLALLRSRRFFQYDAEALLTVDKRAPVLFLRSFSDEKRIGSVFLWPAHFFDISLESRIAGDFSQTGPFVAIGSPADKVPLIGAARKLVSKDAWQDVVQDWIARSRLIVMYAGSTESVNWELNSILEKGRASETIIVMPETKEWTTASYARAARHRFDALKKTLSSSRWRDALERIENIERIRALHLKPNGEIVVITSGPRNRDSYHLATLMVRQFILDGAQEQSWPLYAAEPMAKRAPTAAAKESHK